MNRKRLGWILKAPAIFVLVAAFFGGIYAMINDIGGVTIASPILIGGVVVLYLFGEYYHKENEFVSFRSQKDLNVQKISFPVEKKNGGENGISQN